MNSKDKKDAIVAIAWAIAIGAMVVVLFLMMGNYDTQVQKTKQACYNANHNPKECE